MKTLRPHNPHWKEAFAAEAARLRTCFGAAALDIQHIGSTAIPGIMAKPVIDILVTAHSLAGIDAQAPAMAQLGYEARGEHGIPGRRYFKKQPSATELGRHVHVFAQGSEHIARHIQLRDFLLRRPDIAQDYSALKQSLANPAGELVADYAARKAEFVRRVQQMAQQHFSQTHD